MSETSLPEVHLHDTYTGRKRRLETIAPGRCGIYCCGPTVYGLTHLGNLRAAVVPDVLVRFLRHEGWDVKYVRNITDIDDKIIDRSRREGVDPGELARRYTAEYHRDLAGVNMLEPDVEPAVSDHLEPIVSLVTRLLEKGLAYSTEEGVYFRVREFADYGRLSKRSLEEMLEGAGSRIEVDDRKETPLDFALWKAAKPGEPAWESPWGPGRPGWHIECSAMSSTHLGEDFDIHCGGRDLIFPHHENEIAQSQGAHGAGTFARYWLHNGFINFDGEKMSKSLGNFFTTREITALYDPETVRYFLLTVHYRSGLNFELELTCPDCDADLPRAAQESGLCPGCGTRHDTAALRERVRFPGLEEAEDRLAYVYRTLAGARGCLDAAKASGAAGEPLPLTAGMRAAFLEHMRNDLNTSGALGTLSKPLNEVNGLLAGARGVSKAARRATLERFVTEMEAVARILGCFGQEPAVWLERRRDGKARRLRLDVAGVEERLAARQRAREAKDWAVADRLRDELAELGVAVQDGPDGSTWDFA